jgi:glycosyltransferase involved in cell wall biosynthesis
MKRRKMNLSVGIPAYNEAENIRHLIESVFRQKSRFHTLTEIIVIADGCTDTTVPVIRKITDKRMRVIVKGKRSGQAVCQNEMLKMYRGDAILFLEADTLLASDRSIEEYIKASASNPAAGLIYGPAQPLHGNNFYGKAVASVESIRQKHLIDFRSGNNLYMLQHAKMLTKPFTDRFAWPADVHDDTYIYMYCAGHAIKTVFAPNACANYRAPSTLADYIAKNRKFRLAIRKLRDYFPRSLIDSVTLIPASVSAAIFADCVRSSIPYTLIYGISFMFAGLTGWLNPSDAGLWETAASTKKLVINKPI